MSNAMAFDSWCGAGGHFSGSVVVCRGVKKDPNQKVRCVGVQ